MKYTDLEIKLIDKLTHITIMRIMEDKIPFGDYDIGSLLVAKKLDKLIQNNSNPFHDREIVKLTNWLVTRGETI